jgi:hypothetical protein
MSLIISYKILLKVISPAYESKNIVFKEYEMSCIVVDNGITVVMHDENHIGGDSIVLGKYT